MVIQKEITIPELVSQKKYRKALNEYCKRRENIAIEQFITKLIKILEKKKANYFNKSIKN